MNSHINGIVTVLFVFFAMIITTFTSPPASTYPYPTMTAPPSTPTGPGQWPPWLVTPAGFATANAHQGVYIGHGNDPHNCGTPIIVGSQSLAVSGVSRAQDTGSPTATSTPTPNPTLVQQVTDKAKADALKHMAKLRAALDAASDEASKALIQGLIDDLGQSDAFQANFPDPGLFSDGFESGDTSAWSNTTP